MTDFNKCRDKYIDKVFDEFENKKLKIAGKRIVKDRKQAIAIALNYAQDNCKYSPKDYIEIEKKVKEFLYDDDRKISEKRVPLTNVIETKSLIEYYSKNNKRKANKLKDDLIKRITDAGRKGIKISKNVFNELYQIL